MIPPPLSPDEPLRLEALRRTRLVETPLEARFERITRMAQRLLNVPVVTISLVDQGKQWFKSTQGINAVQTSREISFCGHAILDNSIMEVQDARVDPRFTDNPLVTGYPGIVFYAGAPLMSEDGHNIGVFCVIDHKPRKLSQSDAEALRDLANMAQEEMTKAARNAVHGELLEQIDEERRRSMVDPLTRLWNREGISQVLQHRHANPRPGTVTGLILADVDHFKAVNDSLGHAAGDAVLRETAKRMLAALRDVDNIGRYGGEEFLIVTGPIRSPDEAGAIAERIRLRVCEHPVTTDAGPVPVTVSLGAATFGPGESRSPDELVALADAALYAAKHNGRNRVELASAAMSPPRAAA